MEKTITRLSSAINLSAQIIARDTSNGEFFYMYTWENVDDSTGINFASLLCQEIRNKLCLNPIQQIFFFFFVVQGTCLATAWLFLLVKLPPIYTLLFSK